MAETAASPPRAHESRGANSDNIASGGRDYYFCRGMRYSARAIISHIIGRKI